MKEACNLFKSIAENVWDEIIRYHDVGIHKHECAITNEIIVRIRENNTIGVWSQNSKDEAKNGNDIDIFVEVEPGQYVWWALQAKVLYLDGKYKHLRKISNSTYQWDKLYKFGLKAGCNVRYLLYNGKANFSGQINSCDTIYNEKQFGCSLVQIDDLRVVALKKYTPSFEDFHPKHALPWNIITCCSKEYKTKGMKMYNTTQLKDALKKYDSLSNDFLAKLKNNDKLNSFKDTAINDLSESIGRHPGTRIVINGSEYI